MNVVVKDLVETCDYNIDYFFKVLRDNGISNRKILDKNDVKTLRKNVKAVNNKSYVLLIELNKILDDKFEKVVK